MLLVFIILTKHFGKTTFIKCSLLLRTDIFNAFQVLCSFLPDPEIMMYKEKNVYSELEHRYRMSINDSLIQLVIYL